MLHVLRIDDGRTSVIKWFVCAIGVGLLPSGSVSAQAMTESSASATSYIDHALDIMQEHSLRRKSTAWTELRRKTLDRAAGSQNAADTYEAIRYALQQLGDHHSFLQLSSKELQAKDKEAREKRKDAGTVAGPREPWPPSPYIDRRTPSGIIETIDGVRVGRLIVPEFDQSDDGRMHVYAETLRGEIFRLAAQQPMGWIIDLRGNLGGNMWPMIAGLGPLAGSGALGSFVDANGNKDSWFVAADGSGINGHDGKRQILCWTPADKTTSFKAPAIVAVLVDHGTASSGEAVAISFAGRPYSRSFGRPTHGQSTANEGFPLEDGANLVLTTSVEADRTGKFYLDGIEPDVELPEEKHITASGTVDPMTKAAAGWIKTSAARR